MMRRGSIGASVITGTLACIIALSACGTESAPFAANTAWSRPTPVGSDAGVVYLRLSTDIADTLVGASVDDSIAGSVEMHATTTGGGGGLHSHGGGGGDVVSMGSVDAFELAAGETLEFQPGGNHLMLVDLTAPLELGGTFDVVLEFSSGRQLVVDVTVADNRPG